MSSWPDGSRLRFGFWAVAVLRDGRTEPLEKEPVIQEEPEPEPPPEPEPEGP